MQTFILEVHDEIAARRRFGLMMAQVQFRCNKWLLQHGATKLPAGLTVKQAADFVEGAVA